MKRKILEKCIEYCKENLLEAALDLLSKHFLSESEQLVINTFYGRLEEYENNDLMGIPNTQNLTKINLDIRTYISKLKKKEEHKEVIMFVGASPSDKPKLEIEKEFGIVEDRLKSSDSMRVEPLMPATIKELQQLSNKFQPRVFHFACHGNPMGLFLVGDNGTSKNGFMNLQKFKKFILKRNKSIDCVILSACESKDVGDKIKDFIPCVIVMNQKVHDKASIEFATGFYNSLRSDDSTELNFHNAFIAGKERLELLSLADAFTVEKFQNESYT